MRPEEIVELVGNIANRSDIREAQSKQVQAIYDLLAVRERETWEAAAVAVGGSGGGRSAYSYRDEFLQNASLCIQVNDKGDKECSGGSSSPQSSSGTPTTSSDKSGERASKVDDVRNYALENAAELVQGWHVSKGGYTELAYQIRALKSSPVERGDVTRPVTNEREAYIKRLEADRERYGKTLESLGVSIDSDECREDEDCDHCLRMRDIEAAIQPNAPQASDDSSVKGKR